MTHKKKKNWNKKKVILIQIKNILLLILKLQVMKDRKEVILMQIENILQLMKLLIHERWKRSDFDAN